MEEPGQFPAPFVPSRPARTRSRFQAPWMATSSTLSVTSGPETFDEVQDIAAATFPAAQYPTNADLASRIEQESEPRRPSHGRTGESERGERRRIERQDVRHHRDRGRRARADRASRRSPPEARLADVLAHAGTPDEQVALVTVVAGLWVGWAGVSRLRRSGVPATAHRRAPGSVGAGCGVVVAGLTLPRQFLRPNPASATPTGARPASTATLRSNGRPRARMSRGRRSRS